VSVLVQRILTDALMACSDPGARNISPDEQLLFYNRTARRVATRLNVLEYEATFDTVQGIDLYKMPDDCKTLRSLWATLTPELPYSYWPLREIFEDEHRQLISRNTPSSDPSRYYARQSYYHIYPAPASTVVDGGKLIYWGLPADVTNPAIETLPFADLMQDLVTEGVIIHLLTRLTRLDEAAARRSEWEASMTADRDTFEDRSNDRRPSLRTRSRYQSAFDGQV